MRKIKKILLVLTVVILIMPSFLVTASEDDNTSKEAVGQGNGAIASKDEVVYATLDASGNKRAIYVVNTLEIVKEGTITDYGTYSSVKNLTDLSPIEKKDNSVQFTAPEGKFYYQGNMNDETLPWDIGISYFLDEQEISPEELAGKDGHVKIRIETSANETLNPTFFENYLLQISLTLDSGIFRNIVAKDGMIANAGKNKQVTFTVMPEQEEELVVEADARGFELDGINITGIPSSMPIDAPEVDEMIASMESLTDAIASINDGVTDLSNGVSELNTGVFELRDGSREYNIGISDLNEGSAELVTGSKDIEEALETMNQSLSNMEEIDLSEMEQLVDGLTQIASGLGETAQGLDVLKTNYGNAYSALDAAMLAIPAYEITDRQIQALYESNANEAVVDQLVETYKAAQTAKGTYASVKQGFDAVESTLDNVIGSLTEMANNLNAMANDLSASLESMNSEDGMTQLQEGIQALASNYKAFHTGLLDYTGGVGQLSDSYQELHNGIVDVSGGVHELEDGVSELNDGTAELEESTRDLPNQITKEINNMMAEFDKSDFEPVSFVSDQNNENINSVQFVLKTESIKYEEPEKNEEPEEEEVKGFWARLLDLFR